MLPEMKLSDGQVLRIRMIGRNLSSSPEQAEGLTEVSTWFVATGSARSCLDLSPRTRFTRLRLRGPPHRMKAAATPADGAGDLAGHDRGGLADPVAVFGAPAAQPVSASDDRIELSAAGWHEHQDEDGQAHRGDQ